MPALSSSKDRGLAMPYRRSVRREDGRKKKGQSEGGGGRDGGKRGDMGIQACGREEIPGRVFSTVEPGKKNPDACLTAMRERDGYKETVGRRKNE